MEAQNKKERKSIIELKAELFDIDNEIKRLQNMYRQVGQVLQQTINKQNEIKEGDSNSK